METVIHYNHKEKRLYMYHAGEFLDEFDTFEDAVDAFIIVVSRVKAGQSNEEIRKQFGWKGAKE